MATLQSLRYRLERAESEVRHLKRRIAEMEADGAEVESAPADPDPAPAPVKKAAARKATAKKAAG